MNDTELTNFLEGQSFTKWVVFYGYGGVRIWHVFSGNTICKHSDRAITQRNELLRGELDLLRAVYDEV